MSPGPNDPWTNVPDLVNKTEVAFYFNMTHQFLLGIERGMYDNQSIELDPQCFGEPFVTKLNQLAVMWHADPIANLIPEFAIVYQLYYMLSDKCQIDKVINDFFLFCWNKGCYPDEIGANAESNYLYMTRSLIDASIVWMEGVPQSTGEGHDQWRKLSHQTGETVAEIFKKFTMFETQHKFDA